MTSKTYRDKTSPYGSSSEEDQGIIRCICEYSEDDGFTIQCETCLVWQHAVCVDIAPETVPDKYLCDICMPRPLDFKKAKEHQRLRIEILQRQQKELFKKRPNIKSKKFNERVINGYGIAASQDAKKKNGARSKTRPFTQRRYSDTADDDSHNQGPMFLEQDLKYEYIEDNILADVDVTEIFHKAAKEAKKGGSKSKDDSGDNDHKEKIEGSPSGRRRSSSVDSSPIVFMESTSLSTPKIRIGVHEIPNEANPQYPQFGLFADSNISKGRFIVEYKGEVYLKSSYKRVPNNQYRILGIPKQFVLFHPTLDLCVDSRRSGNESRFVRKHCKPNAELRTIVVTEGESTIAHLGIFSKTPIPEGEEITIGWEWDINNQELDSLPKTEFTHRKRLSMNSLIATFGCACMEPSKCLIYKIFKSEVEDNSSGDSSDDKMKINRVIKVNGRQEASDEDFDVDNLSGEDSLPKVTKPPVGVQIKRKPGRPPKRKVTTDGANIKGPKTPGKRRKDREGSNSHSSPLPELSSDGSASLEINSEFKARVKHQYHSSPIISSDEDAYGHKGRNSSDRRNKRSSFSPMESSGDEEHRSPSKRVRTNIARVGLKKYWIQRYQGCENDPKGKKIEPEIPEKNLNYESECKIAATSNDGGDIDNAEDGDIIVDEPKVVDDVPSKYRSPLSSPRKNDIPSKDSTSSSNVELNEKPEIQQEQTDLHENSHGTQKDVLPELNNLPARSKSLKSEQESFEDVNVSDDMSVPSSPDSHQIVEIDVVGDSPETITLRVDNKPLMDRSQVKPTLEKSFEKSSVKSQLEPAKEELSNDLSLPLTEETPLKECTPDQPVDEIPPDNESSIKKIQENLEVTDIPCQKDDNVADSAKTENIESEETVEPSNTAPIKVKLSLKEYQENLRKAQKAQSEENQPLTQKPSESQVDNQEDNKDEEVKDLNIGEETALSVDGENTGASAASTQGKVKISLQEYNLKRKRESNLSSTSKPNAEAQEDGGLDKSVDLKLEDMDVNEKECEINEDQDISSTPKEDLSVEIAPIKFEEQIDLIPVPKTEYFPVSFPVKNLSVNTSVLEIENHSEMKVETSSLLDKEPQDITIDAALVSNSKDEPEDIHEQRKPSEPTQVEDIDTPSPSPSSVKPEETASAGGTTHTNPPDSISTSYQSKPYDPANPEDPTEDGPEHAKDLNEREADYYGQRPGPLSSNPNLAPSRRSDSYRPGYRFEFRDARERESRERDYRDMNMNAAGLPSGPGWSDDRYQRDRMRDRERERDKDRGRAHKDWASRDSYRRFNGIYRDRDYPFGREGYEVENRYSGRMKPNSFGVVAPDYRDNRYGGFRANNYPLPPSVPFNGRNNVDENRFKDSSNRDSPYGSPGVNPVSHLPSKSLETHGSDKHISSIPKSNQWATVPGSNNTRS